MVDYFSHGRKQQGGMEPRQMDYRIIRIGHLTGFVSALREDQPTKPMIHKTMDRALSGKGNSPFPPAGLLL